MDDPSRAAAADEMRARPEWPKAHLLFAEAVAQKAWELGAIIGRGITTVRFAALSDRGRRPSKRAKLGLLVPPLLARADSTDLCNSLRAKQQWPLIYRNPSERRSTHRTEEVRSVSTRERGSL